MKINRQSLDAAVREGILSDQQAEQLTRFLRARQDTGPSFDFTHVLYYLGGLIAIGAMTIFMNLGWQRFGGAGILMISLAYAGGGLLLANRFRHHQLHIPAALCATFVVALTPLAVYGLQQAMGWWPGEAYYREYHRFIRWHWIYMELATLAVGALLVWHYRYPFLLLPVAVTLWYLSMDLAPLLMSAGHDFRFRTLVSIYFGLLVLGLAFWVDVRSARRPDFAFWLYMAGILAFWGGLTLQGPGDELSRFFYLCINLLLILTGVILIRRVFVVFGAIGCALYLGQLATYLFRDSWLFPVVLTAIGLLIIWLGVLWQRHEKQLGDRLREKLPLAVRKMLEE